MVVKGARTTAATTTNKRSDGPLIIRRRRKVAGATLIHQKPTFQLGRFLARWWPATTLLLYFSTWLYFNPIGNLSLSSRNNNLSHASADDETAFHHNSVLKQTLIHSVANRKKKSADSSPILIHKIPPLRGKILSQTLPSQVGAVYKYLKYAPATEIPFNITTAWALEEPLLTPTRNHETVLLEYGNDEMLLINILGRHSRAVQWRDLQSGKQQQRIPEGRDPVGKPLNDLNHVASVVVDRIEDLSNNNTDNVARKEVWIPCGFHNDKVGREISSQYVRILDLETMELRAGPKLPFAGGACTAAAIPLEGPDHPPYICSFGGTHGNHDTGKFLPYASCYDRIRERWVHPFGKLPFGFDHGSLALIPPGVCQPTDPSRILIFNYRTKAYGTQKATVVAFDLPSERWSEDELSSLSAETPGPWYIYADIPYNGIEDELNAPRDAAGLVLANGGRFLVNFGGVHYHYDDFDSRSGFRRRDFSVIRAFDICAKEWKKVGDLGVETYAIQSVASERWNLAFTCGGEARDQEKEDLKAFHRNSQWCIVNRLPGLQLENQRMKFTKAFPSDFVAGGKAVYANFQDSGSSLPI